MHPLIIEWLLFFLQPGPSGGGGAAAPAAGAGGGADAGGGGGIFGGNYTMFLLPLMFGVFYFLVIRPQNKRQRETENMLKGLKRGDRVRTTGGIRGELAEVNDTDVNLIIAERVKINILRSAIAGLDVPAGEPGGKKAEPKPEPKGDDAKKDDKGSAKDSKSKDNG